MAEPILIYGAGGFARELYQLVMDMNAAKADWELVGFLSDAAAERGAMVHGVPVLGGREVLSGGAGRYHVALGLGSPQVRHRVAQDIAPFVRSFPVLVHPNAGIGRRVALAPGVIITAGNIVTVDVTFGSHVLVNLACTIGHDSVIGSCATLSPGVNLSGRVQVGEGCDIGTGSAIVQGVSIGEWSIVGAGAVVARDLPSNCTAVGVPAKVVKERPAGWHRS